MDGYLIFVSLQHLPDDHDQRNIGRVHSSLCLFPKMTDTVCKFATPSSLLFDKLCFSDSLVKQVLHIDDTTLRSTDKNLDSDLPRKFGGSS